MGIGAVRDSVVERDLDAAELRVGRIDFSVEQSAQRAVARQDNVRVLYLDDALAQTNHVCADANSTTYHQ